MDTHCRALSPSKKYNDEIKAVNNFEDWSWHESTAKICAKNLADTGVYQEYALNSSSSMIPLVLRKNTNNKSASSTTEENSSTLTVVLIAGLVSFSVSLLVFAYVKYQRPKRPCIRLNFRRSPQSKNFQRLDNIKQGGNANVHRSNSKSSDTNQQQDEDTGLGNENILIQMVPMPFAFELAMLFH